MHCSSIPLDFLGRTFLWQRFWDHPSLTDVPFCSYCCLLQGRSVDWWGNILGPLDFLSIGVLLKWQQMGGYWFLTSSAGGGVASEKELMHKRIDLGIREKCIAHCNKIIKIMPCLLIAFKKFYCIAYLLLYLVRF